MRLPLKFRLLPTLIAASALVIVFRGADVASRLVSGAALEPVHAARAESAKADTGSVKDAAAKDGAAKDAPAGDQGPDKHATPEASLSPAEMDLLQSLQKRREELDQRDVSLQQRETTLKVTEGRVDQKLAELSELKAGLEKLLEVQKQKQNDEVMSLVKIYSAMKPTDAARVFNTLEMPVLLSVVSHMKEQKSASIIAAMQPDKARDLTMHLADLRQLPEGSAADSGSAGAPIALTPTAAQAAQGAAEVPAAPPPVAQPTQPPASASPAASKPMQSAAPAPAGQKPAAKPAG